MNESIHTCKNGAQYPKPFRYRTVGDKEFGFERVRVAIHHGCEGYWSKYTHTCSGCSESNEGHMSHYPYDAKAQCHIGSGCDECGYTGKVRDCFFIPFDHGEFDAACEKERAEELEDARKAVSR